VFFLKFVGFSRKFLPPALFVEKVPQKFNRQYLNWFWRYSNGEPFKKFSFFSSFQWCSPILFW